MNQGRGHRRRAILVVALSSLALAAGTAWVVRAYGGARPAASQGGRTTERASEVIIDYEDQLTKEQQQAIATLPEGPDRQYAALVFYRQDRLTGDPNELAPFLGILARHAPVLPSQPDPDNLTWTSYRTSSSLTMITRAWMMWGPHEGLEDEVIRQTARVAADKDVVIRASAAMLLEVLGERTNGLPPEASRVLRSLMSNEEIRSLSDRMLERLRATM